MEWGEREGCSYIGRTLKSFKRVYLVVCLSVCLPVCCLSMDVRVRVCVWQCVHSKSEVAEEWTSLLVSRFLFGYLN